MKLNRKVMCLNHTSLSVVVPAMVAREMKVKKGDYVSIDYSNGIMTVEKAPDKIKQAAEANRK